MQNTHVYPAIDAEIARNGMNISTFSAAIGIDRGDYYRWQSNGKIPVPKLLEIARLFRCSTDYLLGYDSAQKTTNQ